MVATSLLSLVLLVLAGVLLDSHRREWAAARAVPQDADQAEENHRFARRRMVRRTVASAAIAVVGLFIGLWPVVPREPFWVALYLAGLVSFCATIFLLGVGDAWASGRHFQAEGRRRLAEETRSLARLLEGQRDASDEVSKESEGKRR